MASADMNGTILSTPVTHTDWIWRHEKRIGHGPESVKYILDRCKEVGWKKLYWRCFDGGLACYESKLMDSICRGVDEDNYHAWESPGKVDLSFYKRYAGFDSLQAAVEYGHKIDLEIHAWLSINEDDHAWGMVSRFCRQHPQFRWGKRSGIPYNSQLSFAFEEVRNYKLGLISEILQYDIDGVFFDWMRTGDIRNEPQATDDGTADFGYERPLVDGFIEAHGVDPRTLPNNDLVWVRYRAEPQTNFMRAAHKLIKEKSSSLLISMMGHHKWSYRGCTPHINGNLYGLLLDVETWAKDGLIDSIVTAGYFAGGGNAEVGNAKKAYAYAKDEVKGKCDVWLYWWVPESMSDFDLSVRTARQLGAKQILYWESDYIDRPEMKTFADDIKRRLAESQKRPQ